jgi:hypothetical protein
MTAQATGGYRCNVCGMVFNSLSDLDHLISPYNERFTLPGITAPHEMIFNNNNIMSNQSRLETTIPSKDNQKI